MLVLVLLAGAAQAATIQGTVYDFSLDKVENGKVVISEPKQQMVLVNSSYSFTVDEGEYSLIGYKLEGGKITATAKETIVVSGEGDYNVDLILFPSFAEEEEILEETQNIDLGLEEEGFNYMFLVLLGLVIVLVGLVYLSYLKYKKYKSMLFAKEKRPDLSKDLKEIVDFVKKEGGRVTQKEIRKEFPLSEGKISLMVSELEEKGVVKRIKKGRGNIIVLK